ncbi:type VI secretion system membrane subunit TssM [Yoonia sp. SS1-5]|uniref:Type VI secretion system membrane subunit TssM n=1 Tax=Yoonia rhodophyticola TaxID=3137370 RepID=A0AAN0NJ43_9RHOB
MRVPLMMIGILGLIAAIWIGLPMIPLAVTATVWLRATLIGVTVGLIVLFQILGWRKRRAAAKEIEEALTPDVPTGDGAVLSERMNDALATLKKSGGASYLYDLPWYVIIGPPGAGKTTALRNSGIEFPLSNAEDAGVVSGFGGTRYCDWWFAEDAILIDTAGRYTTQDSDKEADESSWQAFLDLLKKSRPNQPINGVILAFSVEDMMNASSDDLARHSQIVRDRLAEVHDKLRIDFPVYILFTKCDLISGFREYFSSFSLNRRKAVWGVTFQTKDRKAQTHEQVPAEFDALVSRLSDEIIDRLNEEPDGISRVAIFGLPGQMALLRDNVTDFLRRVFEPTRYQTSAILRGFYFTSGTQEGTPIDQVLGAMSRNDQAPGAFAPSFMSGQGKSFFLHDVLRRVIFAERDWVGHDARAVRRNSLFRGLTLAALGLVTVGLLSAFGFSYWQNKQLVDDASAQAQTYAIDAQREIARAEIDDWDPLPVLPYLERMRNMPAGYGAAANDTVWNGFGLRQSGRIKVSARRSYADALEQMLRPRLILDVERRLPELRTQDDPAQIYRALKVYMLLAGQGPRPDDAAIKSWFDEIWREAYFNTGNYDAYDQLNTHLDAMLDLDDTRDIAVPIDDSAITLARSAIVQMSLADQAYAIIKDKAALSSLEDWTLTDPAAPEVPVVFSTNDGTDLDDVRVPALYTFDGYWFLFMEELINVREVLEADKWVLGDQANAVNFDAQLAGLNQALQRQYARDFEAAWQAMLDRLQLNNMSADKPQYDILATAASSFASPIVRLANEINRETKLTTFLDELAEIDPTELASGDFGENVGNQLFRRFKQSSGGLQRILLEAASGSKNQNQVNGSNGDGPRREAERIEDRFVLWHLLVDGPDGQRPIDIVISDLSAIRENRRLAAQANPVQANALLPQLLSNLTANNSRLPPKLVDFINDAERDFRSQATDASVAEMNQALSNQITFACREGIEGYFPFTNSSAHVPMAEFGRFFGVGGDMDKYFNEYLAAHVVRTADGLAVDPNSPLADRLSENMLRQFDRAQRIQRAFFGNGGAQPEIQISLTLVGAHSTIEQVLLGINGTVTIMEPGGGSQTVTWPGAGSSTTLDAKPREVGVDARQWRNGQWTIVRFIAEASSRQALGNGVRLTHQLGQRFIQFDMEFSTADNPFAMPELRNFSCPQSVD